MGRRASTRAAASRRHYHEVLGYPVEFGEVLVPGAPDSRTVVQRGRRSVASRVASSSCARRPGPATNALSTSTPRSSSASRLPSGADDRLLTKQSSVATTVARSPRRRCGGALRRGQRANAVAREVRGFAVAGGDRFGRPQVPRCNETRSRDAGRCIAAGSEASPSRGGLGADRSRVARRRDKAAESDKRLARARHEQPPKAYVPRILVWDASQSHTSRPCGLR
jgi:hypothetical protein